MLPLGAKLGDSSSGPSLTVRNALLEVSSTPMRKSPPSRVTIAMYLPSRE